MINKSLKTIFDYTPETAHSILAKYLKDYPVKFKISKERYSKHGDYRLYSNGLEQISINSNLSPYRFLITLVHEISHLVAFKTYGKSIKPHGKEWKNVYKDLMTPLINSNVFPKSILIQLKKHFINPKASTDSDLDLIIALNSAEKDSKLYLYNIPEGKSFKIYNGRIFIKGPKKRKRFECEEKSSGIKYLFNPLVEVLI